MLRTFTSQECHKLASFVKMGDLLVRSNLIFTVETDYGGARESSQIESKTNKQFNSDGFFTSEVTKITPSITKNIQFEEFVLLYNTEFLDLLVLITAFYDNQIEPSLILPSENDKIWLVIATNDDKNKWSIFISTREKPKKIGVQYSFPDFNRKTQIIFYERSFNKILDWLTKDFPICERNSIPHKTFAIRINDSELWFAKYPLTVFCSSTDYEFWQHKNVEYLIARKSFSKYCSEKSINESELRDIEQAYPEVNQ
jgi:hypothetical protein